MAIDGFTYVALKRLKVGDEYRLPGDLVPEAAEWPNVHNYISAGYISVVNEPRVQRAPKKAIEVKPAGVDF